jgi:hypothetical protein
MGYKKRGAARCCPAARKSVCHGRTATGVESRILMSARVSASAAVSAVVALPQGLPRFGGEVVATPVRIMLFGPPSKALGYPGTPDPDPTKPYMMWPNTPYEHAMVPVK